ncbi:MAG: hypothetical protein D6683_09505, partial [Actinomyces sp.]
LARNADLLAGAIAGTLDDDEMTEAVETFGFDPDDRESIEEAAWAWPLEATAEVGVCGGRVTVRTVTLVLTVGGPWAGITFTGPLTAWIEAREAGAAPVTVGLPEATAETLWNAAGVDALVVGLEGRPA